MDSSLKQLGGNVTQNGLALNNIDGRNWTQQYSGNAATAMHTFTSTDGIYTVSYTGSNIVNNAAKWGMVFTQELRTPLPNPADGQLLKMTYEGALTRFTTGNVGSGTINKLTYEIGSLKVEFFGSIIKTFVPDIGNGV